MTRAMNLRTHDMTNPASGGRADLRRARHVRSVASRTGEETTVGFRKGTVPFSSNENWDSPPLVDSPVLRVRLRWFARVRRDPAGFSLLEILISIFIILFGLVGLVSLLPVGRYEMAQTQIYDYSAACGRAGLHEIKTRRMLGYMWNSSSMTTVSTISSTVMLDPLGYAKNTAWTSFPSSSSMVRFSLPASSSSNAVMPSTAAERVFRWQDDLVFDIPEGGLRPRQMYFTSLTASTTAAGSGLVPQSEGNYSWMAMVAPLTNSSGVPTYYYTVSVVVFFKRDFTEPSCSVTMLNSVTSSGGLLISDVQLSDTTLDVRENRWIMLMGNSIYQWYRVVSVGDLGGLSYRNVSLAGPDWPSTTAPTTAIVPPGVVGVYTETLELDQ